MDNENLTPQYRIEEYLEAIVEGWAEATQYPYPDYPSWRIEEFLDAFITYIWEDGDHPRHPCPDPVWRLEECLRAIYDVMTGAATPWAFPTPTNSIEEYLAAIHAYLADGTELPVPEPVWRIEQWLAYVLDAVKQGGGIEKTVSGTMVHITDALAKAALSVLASIEPIQDLHGYSFPWPAGGGVNKLDPTHTYTGMAYNPTVGATFNLAEASPSKITDNGGGSFTFDVATAWDNRGWLVPVTAGNTYRVSVKFSGAGVRKTDGLLDSAYTVLTKNNDAGNPINISGTFTPSVDGYWYCCITTNANNDITIDNPIFSVGSTAPASWTPYENLCPISGRTGMSVYVSPTQDVADATTYAVDWTSEAGTVYGGTLDVVTGVLVIKEKYVKLTNVNQLSDFHSSSQYGSYAILSESSTVDRDGQPSTMPIASSMTECVIFENRITNPTKDRCYIQTAGSLTIRARNGISITTVNELFSYFENIEVVYKLATPLTYQLTPQEVQMLLGENYVWSSSGDTVSVTYYAEGNANPLQSLNILLGGNYSNPKTADDVSDREALEIILGGNK